MTLFRLTAAHVSATLRADSTSEAMAMFQARFGVRALTCRVIA